MDVATLILFRGQRINKQVSNAPISNAERHYTAKQISESDAYTGNNWKEKDLTPFS